jgi:hypothetical protein
MWYTNATLARRPRHTTTEKELAMKRLSAYLPAALVTLTLSLAILSPVTTRTVKADPSPERCNECQFNVEKRFENCQEVHGLDYQRCYDDFNTGIVHCFRNFCEQ